MGRKIYQIARDFDYCLLQNYLMRIDSEHTVHFDHILFGDKYFYCIVDKSWKGSVLGAFRDDKWIYYQPRSKKKQSIKNPLKVNQTRIDKLSLLTGVDPQIFINIVIINDDCLYQCTGLRSESTYIIHASEFRKLLHEIENRDVKPFDAKAIEKVVEEINQLNIA